MNPLVNKFRKNLGYSLVAQFFTLLQSVLMSIFVAKYLSVEVFAYWQLFLFYSGYVYYICLGLPDGVYLRLGGEKLSSPDVIKAGDEFIVHVLFQSIIAGLMAILVISSTLDVERKIVFLAVAAYSLISNTSLFLSQLLSACNEISRFSKAIVVEKVFAITCTCILLLNGYKGFLLFIVLYCCGKAIELAVCLFNCHSIVFRKHSSLKDSVDAAYRDCKIGLFLTLSTFSSVIISGAARFLIDLTGTGLVVFANLSFAFNMVSFSLMFLRQVGIAVFPVLRQIDNDRRERLFSIARSNLGIVALIIASFILPINQLIRWWLPHYIQSIELFMYLLPVVVFDSYMQVLYTPFMNALHCERALLLINAAAAVVSILLCSISIIVYEDVVLATISTSIAMGVKSISSFIFLSERIHRKKWAVKTTLIESILLLAEIVLINVAGIEMGTMLYMVFLAAYIFYSRDQILTAISLFTRAG